jgi:8-oxo-dGTP diphosphatase
MGGEKSLLGSAVIVEKDGKFLLGERNKKNYRGFWVLPGGRVSYGETIKDAAVREIKEETGLDIEIVRFVGFQEILNLPEDYHRVVFYHLAKVKGGKLKHSDDLSDAGFFSIDEIRKMKAAESVEWALKKAGLWK